MEVQGDVPFLAEEIMRNILKRLPVKSIIRFRCVCKHWKNLIKTPSFVADHLHFSSIQNPSLLFKQNGRYEPLHLQLLHSDMRVLDLQNPPLIGSLPDVRIIGSCNGLLCVAIDEAVKSPFSILLCNSLLVWNPATREVREIPRTRTVKSAEWFDLAKEVFTVIERPPLSDNSRSKFAVYEDKLAKFSISEIGDFPYQRLSSIDLWVLEEDTVPSTERWSWTKKFSSDPWPSKFYFGTIWKNEIVCYGGLKMKNDEQKVALYFINISTNKFKEFFVAKCGDFFKDFNHVESLVPVDNIRNEEP